MKILVADDDPLVTHLLHTTLRGHGYEVAVAADAMQAMMFAQRLPLPAAIILDINMPGGTGIGALQRLKASVKTAMIPVLVVSGTTDPDVPARVAELGADAFLPKPVNPDDVLREIDRLTGRKT